MSQTPAYLIHTTPYSDSRSICRFFTSEFGRVNVLARRPSSSKKQSFYQPFKRYEISFSGRNALKTLSSCEEVARPLNLHGKQLFSAMYINELIDRLVVEDGYSDRLFRSFEWSLQKLDQLGGDTLEGLEPILRSFELSLLEECGFLLDFSSTFEGKEILAEEKYLYIDESGFSVIDDIDSKSKNKGDQNAKVSVFTGEALLAIGRRDFSEPGVRKSAKILLRQALGPVIGDKPIKSRELFF